MGETPAIAAMGRLPVLNLHEPAGGQIDQGSPRLPRIRLRAAAVMTHLRRIDADQTQALAVPQHQRVPVDHARYGCPRHGPRGGTDGRPGWGPEAAEEKEEKDP